MIEQSNTHLKKPNQQRGRSHEGDRGRDPQIGLGSVVGFSQNRREFLRGGGG